MTGDLREAAKGAVQFSETWAAQLREFAPDDAATHSVVMRSAAKNLDKLCEDFRAALAAPPPEPIEGPWNAYQDDVGKWHVKSFSRRCVRASYGPFTESQARRVTRALNKDAIEVLNRETDCKKRKVK